MWIRIKDENRRESCVNLDYISCILPEEDCVKLVYSDGCIVRVSAICGYTYDSLCELLIKRT